MPRGASLCVVALVLALSGTAAAANAETGDQEPCTLADAFKDAGAERQARRAYVRLLRADPSLECAQDGLKDLLAPPTPTEQADALCARAAVYEEANRTDDAIATYKEAVEKVSSAGSCGVEGLEELEPSGLSRTLTSLGDALPQILLGAGVLVAAGLAVLMLGHIRPFGRLLARLPISRTILRPRLTLADLAEQGVGEIKAGTALVGRIRERLQRFRDEALDDESVTYSLDFGTTTQELADIVSGDGQLRSSLGKLGEVSEHTKLVAALIDFLIGILPVERFAVSGVIEPAAGPAASATLALERGPSLAGAVTLTGRRLETDPTAGDYLPLANAAAVWIQYEVATALARRRFRPETAQSYALVREGLDLYQDDRLDEAVTAYEEALALDSRNWAAKVNLAVARARLAEDYVTAEAILADALDEMEGSA